MTIKRSSQQKRLAKWSKLGLSLAAVTVLGGLVESVGFKVVGSTEVYANEQVDPALEARKAEIKTMIQSYRDLVGQIKALNPADYTEESWSRNYDGDVRIYLGAQSIATAYNDDLTFSSLSLDGVDSHKTLNELNATYLFGYQFVENAIPILKQAMADLVPVSKPIETPTDKPAETPVEQPEPTEKPVETPSIISTDSPTAPQLTSGQPTVEDGYDVVTLQYRDENGEDLGEDLMMVYPTSPQRITPPVFEGYEFKEASVGENHLMYSKPISLPYEHQFAQVLTEQDLQSHSNFFGGKIKEALDSLRDGSVYTYILNYRRTSPAQQAPQTKRVRFIIDVKPDVVTGTSSFDGFSRRYVYLHPGESYAFPVDESKFEVHPNQKLTYSYDEVETGKDYSLSVRPKAVTSQPTDKPVEAPANRPAETPTNVQTNANPAGQSASEKQETKEQESSKLTSQYTYKDITGTSSSVNVRVHGQDVGKVASLSVKKENDPAVIAKLPQALAEQQVDLYDIKTLDATGQFVQVTEDATVTLPVAAGKEVDKVIYFLASTGAVEELPFTVDKATNQVSFVVSHFSHYGIVYQANKPVSQAQSGSTGQSAPGKQETKQEAKEQAAPASPSKQATAKSAPTSQPQAKSLPATGEAHSVLHMTGMGLLGLAGLVVKRRSRKSS
ncbi:LPXTG cell wall anchor domain-containing protein [Streptococcus suis]|uniref:LPXTG cell wall anchor domain-containing protein n=2 Tax=Streptococcus suis TaxID=1307 RepID=UPI000424AAB0|nr:LPXTG cell wall anchor domain-containing protein [Streptococcus suis]